MNYSQIRMMVSTLAISSLIILFSTLVGGCTATQKPVETRYITELIYPDLPTCVRPLTPLYEPYDIAKPLVAPSNFKLWLINTKLMYIYQKDLNDTIDCYETYAQDLRTLKETTKQQKPNI